ncbi:META domain-containing protein [Aeromonas sp.]|uniref:META domain-containing protein n=1 Tax=Aeromonas sp. TaxID=647 RepID=UPI002588D1C1|nr:META domain-containing protein [Aeromonas sp.]MCX7127210.1 META domain-containing protein [Aeromonas sp.]
MILLLTGCNQLHPVPVKERIKNYGEGHLSGSHWSITTVYGDEIEGVDWTTNNALFLDIPSKNEKKSMFRVFFGCNKSIGAYETKAQNITFMLGLTTAVLCEEFADAEYKVRQALNATSSYHLFQNELVFYNNDGVSTLGLTRRVPPHDSEKSEQDE